MVPPRCESAILRQMKPASRSLTKGRLKIAFATQAMISLLVIALLAGLVVNISDDGAGLHIPWSALRNYPAERNMS